MKKTNPDAISQNLIVLSREAEMIISPDGKNATDETL